MSARLYTSTRSKTLPEASVEIVKAVDNRSDHDETLSTTRAESNKLDDKTMVENSSNRFAGLTMEETAKPKAADGEMAGLMMPPQGSDFWTTYGNSLRVNGTIEGVCRL